MQASPAKPWERKSLIRDPSQVASPSGSTTTGLRPMAPQTPQTPGASSSLINSPSTAQAAAAGSPLNQSYARNGSVAVGSPGYSSPYGGGTGYSGAGYGSSYGSGLGSSYGAMGYGSGGYGSTYGSTYGSGYGSGYGSTYGSGGYGSSYGSGYGAGGYGSTYGSGYGGYGGAYGSPFAPPLGAAPPHIAESPLGRIINALGSLGHLVRILEATTHTLLHSFGSVADLFGHLSRALGGVAHLFGGVARVFAPVLAAYRLLQPYLGLPSVESRPRNEAERLSAEFLGRQGQAAGEGQAGGKVYAVVSKIAGALATFYSAMFVLRVLQGYLYKPTAPPTPQPGAPGFPAASNNNQILSPLPSYLVPASTNNFSSPPSRGVPEPDANTWTREF